MTTTLNASTAGAGGFIATSDNSGVLALQTAGTTAITVDASQRVGIGTSSPTQPLQINMTTGDQGIKLQAHNTTAGNRLSFADSSGTDYGLVNYDHGSDFMSFYTNSSERMRIDSSGNVGIGGLPENSTQRLYVQGNKSSQGSGSNDSFIKLTGASGTSQFQFMRIDDGNYNGAACGFSLGRNSSTLRSINAGGTVNAAGTDYAEYMVKASSFTVAKGDVVGVNAQGKLTNVFANAIAFVVKSTDPSYVGGDTWGVELEDDELETARQTVDRIAFSGQVPVNVTGATAGQYIIPVNDNGAIKGQAVSNPTFEQYQIAVGKVIAIESDGRAKIIVKVA